MSGLARKDMLISKKQNTSINRYGRFHKKVRKMHQDSEIIGIHIPQLDDRHHIDYTSSANNHLYGPNPTSKRIAWLLSMCFSMYDAKRIVEVFSSFGWKLIAEDLHHEGMSQQIAWENTAYVRRFLGAERSWSIRVQIRLGGELLGWIRKQAMRNIEIVQGLMIEPNFSFRFSMRLDNFFSMAACSYSDFQLGTWSIPVSDRPDWLGTLLYHVQGCFCVAQGLDVPTLARAQMLSVDGFEHYQRFCASLPELGSLRVVEVENGQLQILLNEELLSMYGPKEQEAVQHAAALFLSGSSIVWIDGTPLCSLPDSAQVWYTTEKGDVVGKSVSQKTLQWGEKLR